MGKTLVIVESPTKAKTIRNFLPKDYEVLSSMGHIRDLPNSTEEIPANVRDQEWAQLGVNVHEQFEPLYIIPSSKKKVVKELQTQLKDASTLILATDEDREGESISWHLLAVLKPKIPVKRMVFHEITKEAISQALDACRDIDEQLVRAQETRRILDRLVGYTLSPLLWKKIGGNLSAGRVQSAAVRLVVMRERERRAFKQATYWDLKALLSTQGQDFPAQMVMFDNKRIASTRDFDENTGQLKAGSQVLLLTQKQAQELKDALKTKPWHVHSLEEKPQTRHPAPPFITSTLQQEANRKLNLSARETMRVAQELYQRGFITYMRTDSTSLSNQAIAAARHWVETSYGKNYLSPKPRQYKSSTKGAQEAHEAIRPAGQRFKSPDETGLSGMEFRLYDLIWKRTVASQMADSEQTIITALINVEQAQFRASGKRIDFPGFIRAYVEGSDDPEAALADQEVILPPLSPGQTLTCKNLEALSHETQPPARYTEASLVRTLEKEGVGRPSTYASILQTIVDRGYVYIDKKALIPTFRAFAVVQLLEAYFPNLVDLQFTAEMEEKLDDIAAGKQAWLPYLEQFYLGKKGLAQQVQEQQDRIEPEKARTINFDQLSGKIHIGRFGTYVETEVAGEIVKATIPDTLAPADINQVTIEQLLQQKQESQEPLGTDPQTGLPVYLLNGRYGPYVQLGDMPEGKSKKTKPKRTSVPKNIPLDEVDLTTALALLTLPKRLGEHPNGGAIDVSVGPYGPYVAHAKPGGKKEYRSLTAQDHILQITLPRAIDLLNQPKGTRKGSSTKALKELGLHPSDGQPIQILDGRFGPYIKHAKSNVSVPKNQDPQTVTLEQAVELLAQQKPKQRSKKVTKKKATSR